jgi:carbon monoxide dehydrogenase subunit G
MRHSSSVHLDATPSQVFPFIADLSRYPRWMPIVHDVQDLGNNAWSVELRAKLGLLARSKKLRMVRTQCTDNIVVFERIESDGKTHSPWVLSISITSVDSGSDVEMNLSYGGSLWSAGLLDKVLAHAVDQGKLGLVRVVQAE